MCLRTPHFECGALPIRTTPPGRESRSSSALPASNPGTTVVSFSAVGAPGLSSGWLRQSSLVSVGFAPLSLLRLEPTPFRPPRFEPGQDGFLTLSSRGARIRTGDLCDPNAALYRTEPRPETRGTPPVQSLRSRTGWDGPPGGSAVLSRLQSPRLSARLPSARTRSNPIPSNHFVQRTGWDGPPGGSAVLSRLQSPRLSARLPSARTRSNPIPSNHFVQRTGWDSNPRGR